MSSLTLNERMLLAPIRALQRLESGDVQWNERSYRYQLDVHKK
jgi:hypothetical protein